MMRMRENAESVAFYSGEKQEGGVFKKRFKLLLDNFWKIVEKQNSWSGLIPAIHRLQLFSLS